MQTTGKNKEVSRMQLTTFLAAIILALLVHGLLLVLFEYSPSKKIYNNTRTAGVTFMNLANQAPEKQRELLNWLEYHEPSLISAPNSQYGYNQLSPYVNFRTAHPDKVHQIVLAKSPESKPKKFTALKIHKGENTSSHSFMFNRPKRLAVKAPKVILPIVKYPLIKHDNTVLKLAFSPYLLKDSQKLKAKPMLINYNLERSKQLPRVIVVKSSGNHDFDMLVLRELSLHITDISRGNKDFTISIQWRKEDPR